MWLFKRKNDAVQNDVKDALKGDFTPSSASEAKVVVQPVQPQAAVVKTPTAKSESTEIAATKTEEENKDIVQPTIEQISVSKETVNLDEYKDDTLEKTVKFDYAEAVEAEKADETAQENAKNAVQVAPTPSATVKKKKTVAETDIWGKVVFAPKKVENVAIEPTKPAKTAVSLKMKKQAEPSPVATLSKATSTKTTKGVDSSVPIDKKTAKKIKNVTVKNDTKGDKFAVDKDTKITEDKKMADKKYTLKLHEGETMVEEGDTSIPHGRFTIRKTDKGNFVFKLFSFNNRTVAIGAEAYSSLAGCKGGIASVRKNAATAPIEDQTLKKWVEIKFPKWVIYTDKKGEIRLRLYAANGNIVATTNDGYLSKGAAKSGIDAISHACEGSEVTRWDDMD